MLLSEFPVWVIDAPVVISDDNGGTWLPAPEFTHTTGIMPVLAVEEPTELFVEYVSA
jgi:hypothetical protein